MVQIGWALGQLQAIDEMHPPLLNRLDYRAARTTRAIQFDRENATVGFSRPFNIQSHFIDYGLLLGRAGQVFLNKFLEYSAIKAVLLHPLKMQLHGGWVPSAIHPCGRAIRQCQCGWIK